MKILLAEDQDVPRRLLCNLLKSWHYTISVAGDGLAAWETLQQPEPPSLAILDWDMPGLTGVELCRRIRLQADLRGMYILLLTANDRQEHIIQGLEAGADDYMTKPYQMAELRARLEVGRRVAGLQQELLQRIRELEQTKRTVRVLQELLPICAYCKKIRQDGNYWQQVEEYLGQHGEVTFSHGICPGCYEAMIRLKGISLPS